MLSATQKRWSEWPLILITMIVAQSASLGFLNIPGLEFAPTLLSALLPYLSLTRSWGRLFALGCLFASCAAATAAYPWTTYLSASLWALLAMKLVVMSFAVEGRNQFVLLTVGYQLIESSVLYVLLYRQGLNPEFSYWILRLPLVAIVGGSVAYLCFPWFVRWDEYFEHAIDESRDLNPGSLK
jgi:hypothetical protein